MTEKTEALHEQEAAHIYRLRDEIMRQEIETAEAAAELRRVSIENEALGLHLSERMKDLAAVEVQRDALLEALELAADFLEHSTEFRIGHPGFEEAQAKARAAIKAVEDAK